jgi:hypothetical protein
VGQFPTPLDRYWLRIYTVTQIHRKGGWKQIRLNANVDEEQAKRLKHALVDEGLSFLDIERFKTQRKESPKRAKKLRSGATVNREMAYLRTILNNAIRWELIPKNPASKIMAFAESSGRDCFLSVDEAGRLPEDCSQHLRPIVLCALETGMRRGNSRTPLE